MVQRLCGAHGITTTSSGRRSWTRRTGRRAWGQRELWWGSTSKSHAHVAPTTWWSISLSATARRSYPSEPSLRHATATRRTKAVQKGTKVAATAPRSERRRRRDQSLFVLEASTSTSTTTAGLGQVGEGGRGRS